MMITNIIRIPVIVVAAVIKVLLIPLAVERVTNLLFLSLTLVTFRSAMASISMFILKRRCGRQF